MRKKVWTRAGVPNPDGHFVIYVMKLQSQLMINVPLNIEVLGAITPDSDKSPAMRR